MRSDTICCYLLSGSSSFITFNHNSISTSKSCLKIPFEIFRNFRYFLWRYPAKNCSEITFPQNNLPPWHFFFSIISAGNSPNISPEIPIENAFLLMFFFSELSPKFPSRTSSKIFAVLFDYFICFFFCWNDEILAGIFLNDFR